MKKIAFILTLSGVLLSALVQAMDTFGSQEQARYWVDDEADRRFVPGTQQPPIFQQVIPPQYSAQQTAVPFGQPLFSTWEQPAPYPWEGKDHETFSWQQNPLRWKQLALGAPSWREKSKENIVIPDWMRQKGAQPSKDKITPPWEEPGQRPCPWVTEDERSVPWEKEAEDPLPWVPQKTQEEGTPEWMEDAFPEGSQPWLQDNLSEDQQGLKRELPDYRSLFGLDEECTAERVSDSSQPQERDTVEAVADDDMFVLHSGPNLKDIQERGKSIREKYRYLKKHYPGGEEQLEKERKTIRERLAWRAAIREGFEQFLQKENLKE